MKLPNRFKIGIIGPKDVGKTTLANLLVGYLLSTGIDTGLVDEAAKNSPLPLNESTSIESSLWILGNQIANESLYTDKNVLVCDRTVIDVYPFAKLAVSSNDELALLKKLIETYMSLRPYNILFYVSPAGKSFTAAKLPSEKKYQKELDKEFLSFLDSLPIKYTEIATKDSNEGLKEIIKHLEIMR